MASNNKRGIVAQGNTPGKPEKKRVATNGTSMKSLFSEKKNSSARREWSSKETSTLVLTSIFVYIGKNAHTDRWPMQSDTKFWDAVAGAVNKACNSSRTGKQKTFESL